MVNIIYRIYKKKINGSSGWSCSCNNEIICQEVMQCEDREHFKEIIRDLYGKDIAFRNTDKVKIGEYFCSIISETCYNSESYMQVFKEKCDECGKEYITTGQMNKFTINGYAIERECPVYFEKIKYEQIYNKIFCCEECRDKYEQNLVNEARQYREKTGEIEDLWITKERYAEADNGYSGFIYEIHKKSTNEFYVGKTKYNPIFRWGQHLLTERFKYKNIEDYWFEILEKVSLKDDLAKREAYWINKKRKENPSLCLNIQIPKEEEKLTLFDLDKEE